MLPTHPAAEMFPLMEGAEFDALVADMREHGQREPIVLTGGMVLDGRNRHRACQQLGTQPVFVEWDGRGTPEAFVISKNLCRRHLNESQRAVIAARLATRTREETLVPDAVHRAGKLDQQIRPSSMPVADAANLLKVGRTSIHVAKNMLRQAAPEEIAAVERGETSVNAVIKRIEGRVLTPEQKVQAQEDKVRSQRIRGEIWGKLRSALEAFSEMARPEDVAELSHEYVKRFKFPMQSHLTRAQEWLREFDRHYND